MSTYQNIFIFNTFKKGKGLYPAGIPIHVNTSICIYTYIDKCLSIDIYIYNTFQQDKGVYVVDESL